MACLPKAQFLLWLPGWLRRQIEALTTHDEFWGDGQQIPPDMLLPAFPSHSTETLSYGRESPSRGFDNTSLKDDGIVRLPPLAKLDGPQSRNIGTRPRDRVSQSTMTGASLTDKRDLVSIQKPPTKGHPPIPLDIELLTVVKSFKAFGGLIYNHDSVENPDLLFQVDYENGSSGVVRCGSWIPGKPKSVYDHFKLQIKICEAKKLVAWEWLEDYKHFQKDKMLQISIADSANYGCSAL